MGKECDGKMRIGIYGGSFNPPHLGHMAAARAAIDSLNLDRLVLVPNSQPPHKQLPPGSPTPQQRMAMTAMTTDQLGPKAEVWDVELRREGKSYTVDTLEQAVERWPEDELWLLMGSDMFLSLEDWHLPQRIMELAGICAFARTREDMDRCHTHCATLTQRYNARVQVIEIPDLREVSSTQIRSQLPQGEGMRHLSQQVYGYILREHLYHTHANLAQLSVEELRCVSNSMVKAKRLAHIKGTEEEAVQLARRWGADVDQMRRAGILHDCTKYFPLEQHLAICDRYGFPLDEMERRSEKLLHSKSGAALAQHVFGQEPNVVQAISYHTTGRANMTLEEMILYMADYIEPNRVFEGVEEMRELAYRDLKAAMLMGVEMSMEDMRERNQPIHCNTLEAYNWLKET